MSNYETEATRIRHVDVWGSRALVAVAILALVFTMVNVQTFAASGQPIGSFQWWIAWLLDPMASITLGVAIVYDNILADQGRSEPRLSVVKWFAGIMTWGMNIWQSISPHFTPSGIWLHSVAPGLVLLLAWATPRARQSLAEIVATLERDDAAEQARAEQERRDAEAVVSLDCETRRRQDEELQRVRAELATVRAALSRVSTGASQLPTAPTPAVGAAAVDEATHIRPRPSTTVQPPTVTAQRPHAVTAKTGRGRGQPTAPIAVDLVSHAQSILANEPNLGRRELAKRLSTVVGATVTPYSAQQAKDQLDRPLGLVGERS